MVQLSAPLLYNRPVESDGGHTPSKLAVFFNPNHTGNASATNGETSGLPQKRKKYSSSYSTNAVSELKLSSNNVDICVIFCINFGYS